MRYYTQKEAKKKECPYKHFDPEQPGEHLCKGKVCMAWVEQFPRVVREDHSGAREYMNNIARRRGSSVKRTGPAGSYGVLTIEAEGFCGRLYPK